MLDFVKNPMTLSLYDTMAREKRPFVPKDPRRVTMYVCGPTVYNYAHIGNARPVVVFDVLFRLLRHLYGPEAVVYAANVTDVDDKINKKAAEEGVAIDVITQRYLDIYNHDMSVLGALRPTHQPRATQTMDAIIAMIERLVRNNAAYAAEGHVLFNTQAYADYGKLSRQPMDDMIAGAIDRLRRRVVRIGDLPGVDRLLAPSLWPLAVFADYITEGGIDAFIQRVDGAGRFPAMYPGQVRQVR